MLVNLHVDPKQSALSIKEVKGNPSLIIEEIFDDIGFYVFKNNNSYYSIISKKKVLFWSSYITDEYVVKSNNPIDTIGQARISENDYELTLFVIKANVNDIKYIKFGMLDEEITRSINTDEVKLMYWKGENESSKINLLALSENEDILYYYGFPNDTQYDKLNKINWYEYSLDVK